jgi:hypothetical protein
MGDSLTSERGTGPRERGTGPVERGLAQPSGGTVPRGNPSGAAAAANQPSRYDTAAQAPQPRFPAPQTFHIVNSPRGPVPIRRATGERTFFFDTQMHIDIDGAPEAYHPPIMGSPTGAPPALDHLRNAGRPGPPGQPGLWWGLAVQPNGFPCVQQVGDPAPGFYVSMTALADRRFRDCDPRRYVDATQIPYVSLPGEVLNAGRARVGDFAAVHNRLSGRTAFAIVADVGPGGRIGEGSMALAQLVHVPVSQGRPMRGGQDHSVTYIIFAGSGNGRPRSLADINRQGAVLFQQWGAIDRIRDLFPP